MTLICFTLDTVAMLALKALSGKLECGMGREPTAYRRACCSFPEWRSHWTGFQSESASPPATAKGLLITVALTLEVLFLGVAAAAAITGVGSRRRIIGTTCAFGALLLGGAAIGAPIFSAA